MAYRLHDGVSVCLVADRLVFLDVRGDRYFCLSGETEQAFRALLDGDDPPTAPLAKMEADGLLVPSISDERIILCGAPPLATDDDDLGERGASLRGVASAIAHLAAASLALRIRGLASVLDDLARRKERMLERACRPAQAGGVAAAFSTARGLVASHDRCLPRSLAIARRLIAVGAVPTLVIGVKLQPFGAHCWVTCDGRLVDEHQEDVRHFTPILIV